MVALIAKGHPAYRKVFERTGMSPADVQTLEDLAKFPLTRKEDYMSAPEDYRLALADLPVAERTLWDIVYTTGTTTGRPTPLYTTTFDYYNILELQKRMAAIRGMDGNDVIANLYPLTPHPHGAFLRANYAAMVLGATLVAGFSGQSYGAYPVHRRLPEVVQLLARSGATVLWGVPSYIRRVLLAAEEMGVALPRVRMCAVSGEPCPPEMAAELKKRLAAVGAKDVIISNSLGATEMQGGMVECCEGSGFHNPAPDLFYLEVVDESGRRLPDGETGLLALTHLNRRGTVLFRYVLGDVVKLSNEPCPYCGRVGGRIISQPVRTKGMVKIRGMLVNTELINREMSSLTEVEEFQSVITREDPADPFSMDKLVVRVATRETGEAARARLAELIGERLKAAIGVRPEVVFDQAENIFNPAKQMKPIRLVDERDRR